MATITSDTNLSSISYASGEDIVIGANNVTLTINSTPSVIPGNITASGSNRKIRIENASNTTPIVVTLSANTKDFTCSSGGWFICRGSYISLGSGNDTGGQSFSFSSSPLNGIVYPTYVEVERTAGSGVYETWLVVNSAGYTINYPQSSFAGGTNLLGERYPVGNVFFWNATTRSLFVGDNTNGNTIPSGCNVRIPNIYINSASGSTTPSSRTLINFGSGGNLDCEWVSCSDNIYLGSTNFQSVRLTHFGAGSSLITNTSTGSVYLDGICIIPDPHQSTIAVSWQVSTVTGDVFVKNISSVIGGLPTGGSKNSLWSVYSLIDDIEYLNVHRVAGRTAQTDEGLYLTSVSKKDGSRLKMYHVCTSIVEMSNTSKIDLSTYFATDTYGTTQETTYNTMAISATNCSSINIIGMRNGGKTAPRNAILSDDATCFDINFFNANFDCYSNTAYIKTTTVGYDTNVINCTFLNLRTAPTLLAASGLSKDCNFENVYCTMLGTTASNAETSTNFDLLATHGLSATLVGSKDYTFGNFVDLANPPTTGKVYCGPFGDIGIYSSKLTFGGSAYLFGDGSISLPISGDYFIAESIWTLHGITSFKNASPVYTYTQSSVTYTLTTTPPTSISYEFAVKNPADVSWSSWTSLTGANLNAALSSLSGYDSDVGLNIKLKVTTSLTDSTNKINLVYFTTDIDNTYKANEAYITLNGVNSTDIIKILKTSDDSELYSFTGGGRHDFYCGTNYGVSAYLNRYNSSSVLLMSTKSTPLTLTIGDNGEYNLFFGNEIQLAQSPAVDQILQAVSSYLDATVSSRLAGVSYTAPDNSSITSIKTKTDNLPSNTATAIAAIPTNPLLTNDSRIDNLDATISSRLASAGYTTPPSVVAIRTDLDANSTKLEAIKIKTDNLPDDPASETTSGDIKAKTDALPADPAKESSVKLSIALSV